MSEKTTEQLKQIAKTNDFGAKFKEIEDALLDYLNYFDARPESPRDTQTDKNGIIKIRWNHELEGEQDKATGYIAEVAKLLAHLRGSVYTSEAKSTKTSHRYDSSSNSNNQQQHQEDSSNLVQIEGQDYDTGLPIIEDPSRAVILLRNLAIGHAISQGRNSIGLQDIPIVIKVVLSTAMVSRVKIFDLLLKNGGELKTSDITKGLRVSEPTARRTMREFYALGIAEISAISGYGNAEIKITLRSEYEWFKGKEFEKLREGFIPANNNDGANNDNNVIDSSNGKANDDDNNKTAASAACDSHTLKVDSPPETEENNNNNSAACDRPLLEEQQGSNNDKSSSLNVDSTSVNSEENKIRKDHSSYSVVNNNNSEEDCKYYNNTQQRCNNKAIEDNSDNVSLWGVNHFQHVTESHCHMQSSSSSSPTHPEENNESNIEDLVLQDILEIIKSANGSSIAVNPALESLHDQSEQIRNYIGDKLTTRDNRKVRNLCLKIIRHKNIKVIKTKPQLLVKWCDNTESDVNGVAQL